MGPLAKVLPLQVASLPVAATSAITRLERCVVVGFLRVLRAVRAIARAREEAFELEQRDTTTRANGRRVAELDWPTAPLSCSRARKDRRSLNPGGAKPRLFHALPGATPWGHHVGSSAQPRTGSSRVRRSSARE